MDQYDEYGNYIGEELESEVRHRVSSTWRLSLIPRIDQEDDFDADEAERQANARQMAGDGEGEPPPASRPCC